MAFALIANVKGFSAIDADTFTTGSIDTTGANLLVACINDSTSGSAAVSDSKGNTWTLAVEDGVGRYGGIWYAWNPTSVGTSHTFTLTGTDIFGGMQVYAFSGALTSSDPLDDTSTGNTFGASSIATGSVSPTEDNELLVTGLSHSTTDAATIDSSFTSPAGSGNGYGDPSGDFGHDGHHSAYLIQTTAGSVNPTWSVSPQSGNIYAQIATFKAAATATEHSMSASGTGTSTGTALIVIAGIEYSMTASGTGTSTGAAAIEIHEPEDLPLAASGTGTSSGAANIRLPSDFTFDDDFSGGLTHWSINRWKAAAPAESGCSGHVNPGSNVDGNDDVIPPDDVIIDGSGVLWITCASQNYGSTDLRCDQPFEFADGGVIEVDTVLTFTLASGVTLNGWSHVWVTADPYAVPFFFSDNTVSPGPRNGFEVRLDADHGFTSGNFYPRPKVLLFDNFVETAITTTETVAVVSTTAPTSVVISFTPTHMTITYDTVTVFDEDVALPAELTQGYVYIGCHNHASWKNVDIPSWNTKWTAVRFDGEGLPTTTICRVPDEDIAHFLPDEGEGADGLDIGYLFPTGSLSIPGVPANPVAAQLVASAWFANTTNDGNDVRFNYSLNGGTTHVITPSPTPVLPDYTGNVLISEVVNVAELVTGTNTISWTITDGSIGTPPGIGNIALVVTPEGDPSPPLMVLSPTWSGLRSG